MDSTLIQTAEQPSKAPPINRASHLLRMAALRGEKAEHEIVKDGIDAARPPSKRVPVFFSPDDSKVRV